MTTLALYTNVDLAGGTFVRRLRGFSQCAFKMALDNTGLLTLTYPKDSGDLAELTLQRAVTIMHEGIQYDYRISTYDDEDPRVTTVLGLPLIHDLGAVFLRKAVGLLPSYNLSADLLSPEQYFDTYILPALLDQALPWWDKGTITPTSARSMAWDTESILSFLTRLFARDQVDLSVRRSSTKLLIDAVRIGAAAAKSLSWVGRNVIALRRNIRREGMATAIRASAPIVSGGTERTQIGLVEWSVTDRIGAVVTLAHPGGDVQYNPILEDGQWVGKYLAVRCHEGPIPYELGWSNTLQILGRAWAWLPTQRQTLLWDRANSSPQLRLWAFPSLVPDPTQSDPTSYVAAATNYGIAETMGGKWPVQINSRVYFYGHNTSDAKIHAFNPATKVFDSEASFLNNLDTVSADADYAPSSARIYYCRGGGGTEVVVYDPVAYTQTTTIAVTGAAHGISYVTAKDRLYVWCADRKLRTINPNTNAVTHTLDLTATFDAMLTAAPGSITTDGTFVYVVGVAAGASDFVRVAKISPAAADAPVLSASADSPGLTSLYGEAGAYSNLFYSPSVGVLFLAGASGAATAGTLLTWNVATFGFGLATVLWAASATARQIAQFREVDGVTYGLEYLKGGLWAFTSPTGDALLTREITAAIAASKTITLASAFPTTQLEEPIGGFPEIGRPRIADDSAGTIMTELPSQVAIALYGRIVREVRAEDYFRDNFRSVRMLNPDGALRKTALEATCRPSNQLAGDCLWHTPDNDVGKTMATLTVTTVTGVQETIATNGLAGKILQPGDEIRPASGSYYIVAKRTVLTGADLVPVFRYNNTTAVTAGAATVYRVNPVALKTWIGSQPRILGLGVPRQFGSATDTVPSGETRYQFGAAGVGMSIAIPRPALPGTKLFVGADVAVALRSNTGWASQPTLMRVYRHASEMSTGIGHILDVATTDLPVSGVTTYEPYNRVIEGSFDLPADLLQGYIIRFLCPGDEYVYVRRWWAYVGYGSIAADIARDADAVDGYRTWRLGQEILPARARPQVTYGVQIIEDDADKPFVYGGLTRLVEPPRGIDVSPRIVAVTRRIPGQAEPEIELETTEDKLTRKLVESGAV